MVGPDQPSPAQHWQPAWGFTPSAFRSSQQVARIFNLYRFCIAGLLLLLYYLNSTVPALGQLNTELFLATALGYFGLSVLSLLGGFTQPRYFRTRIFVQILIDIVLLTTMMHCSSMRNGFGILINTTIAGGSLLMGGRVAYILAAVASLSVIVEHIINQHSGINQVLWLSESGLLTATFFATALISYELSNRVKISTDLAEQRQEAIDQLAELNSQIISRLPVGAMVVSPEGKVLLMNALCQRLLGAHAGSTPPLAEFDSQLMKDYLAWRQHPQLTCGRVNVRVADHDYHCQFESLKSEGEPNTLIFLEDSSRTIQQAQQLKLASLGQFTASIAHEIRNPVGAISHAAQLLHESEDLPEQECQLVSIIRKQTDRVNTVIKNILQLSRRNPCVPVWLNLHSWLHDFIDQVHFPEVKFPDIQIVYAADVSREIELYVDPSHLHQVLMNLGSNGLRYSLSATGKASLRCRVGVAVEQTQVVYVDIIDDGPGVPAECLNRLFEPFYTTERTGTGLGLYLVKELCEMNVAKVHYQVAPPSGFFRITFYQTRINHG